MWATRFRRGSSCFGFFLHKIFRSRWTSGLTGCSEICRGHCGWLGISWNFTEKMSMLNKNFWHKSNWVLPAWRLSLSRSHCKYDSRATCSSMASLVASQSEIKNFKIHKNCLKQFHGKKSMLNKNSLHFQISVLNEYFPWILLSESGIYGMYYPKKKTIREIDSFHFTNLKF